MTCCIGKARIYFREPINYWLTYQLPDKSFGGVTAAEPLSHTCESIPGASSSWYKVFVTSPGGTFQAARLLGPISEIDCWRTPTRLQTWLFANGIQPTCNQEPSFWYDIPGQSHTLELDGNLIDPESYTFKVIGEETGTVYREIGGLEECPTVISNICLMGEERYVDVEMGSGLPLLPNFVPDCLVAVTGFPLPENTIQIRKIRVNPTATKPLKPKLPQTVLTLTGLPGCPAEYRIECNPKDECPPDTDCSLDCNGLICCYKDGRVIKSFRK